MSAPFISFEEGNSCLDWRGLIGAIEQGHKAPKALIEDVFLRRGNETLLNRSAWIDTVGLLVKVATIFPGHAPMVNGAVTLFSDTDGTLEAMLDFHLVTKWKTAGDSLLAATKLARPDSENILIVGAGTVGRNLYSAYKSAFPNARFSVWNRSDAGADAFVQALPDVAIERDLEGAVRGADIVTCATMATSPLIKGAWLKNGQHIDLIGAYRSDMREADDDVLRRARIFVDSRDTTISHIGELKIPIESGAINQSDIIADYYDMEKFQRRSNDDITLFKNGGGAHLDLMTARYILDQWRA